MGTKVDIKQKLKYFNKKRILILFFMLVLIVVAITPPLVLFIIDRHFDTWASIFLVIAAIILFVNIYLQQKVRIYNMYYEYYRMLNYNKGILQLEEKIFTTSWIKRITNENFELSYEDMQVSVYRKFVRSGKLYANYSRTEFAIMIAKQPNLDLFETRFQNKLDEARKDPRERIKRSVVLQFNKYAEATDEIINDLNQVINIKNGSNYQVHLSVGYFEKTKELYFLQPVKRFPNKYYFIATSLVYEICHIAKGEENEQ